MLGSKKYQNYLSLQIKQKFFQTSYIYTWERYSFQNTEMGIFTNDVICTGYNGTIYKLIVVRVLLYQSETEMRVIHPGIWTTGNGIHYIMSYGSIGYTLQNLRIFVQYIIAHTKYIPTFTESLPCRSIRTMGRNYLHQTIGIEDYVSAHCW